MTMEFSNAYKNGLSHVEFDVYSATCRVVLFYYQSISDIKLKRERVNLEIGNVHKDGWMERQQKKSELITEHTETQRTTQDNNTQHKTTHNTVTKQNNKEVTMDT